MLCDEDIGTGVPMALDLVGYDTISIVKRGWISKPDIEWLTIAGQKGGLV